MIVDNSVIGSDNGTMSMMDHSKMTLSEVEKVKKMVVVRDSYIKKPEYCTNIWHNLPKSKGKRKGYLWYEYRLSRVLSTTRRACRI